MATPFKLKSGNASAFKNLGSSPVKQDPPKDYTTVRKELSKKLNTNTVEKGVSKEKYSTVKKELSKKISGKNIKVDLEAAKKSASKLPKNWNTQGSSNPNKTPDFSSTNKGKFKAFKDEANKIKTTRSTQVKPSGKVTVKTTPKNWNTQSSKSSKTPGFSTTKLGKFLSSKAFGVLSLMSAGTLSASATPTDKQGKEGYYTSDIQDIIPKPKKKSIWDNKKQIVKR